MTAKWALWSLLALAGFAHAQAPARGEIWFAAGHVEIEQRRQPRARLHARAFEQHLKFPQHARDAAHDGDFLGQPEFQPRDFPVFRVHPELARDFVGDAVGDFVDRQVLGARRELHDPRGAFADDFLAGDLERVAREHLVARRSRRDTFKLRKQEI